MKEKNTLFSIIVPVYNVERYLTECLDSLIVQAVEMSDIVEILLIDDGSRDNSGAICDKYMDRFPGIIKCFHKKNEGLLMTRRYGFQKAHGEYIINCDSDDFMETNALRQLKKIIEKNNRPDVIIFNYNYYDGEKKQIACKDLFLNSDEKKNFKVGLITANYISKEAVLVELMHSSNVISMWGKIFKKTCIDLNMDYSSWGRLNTGEDTLQTIEIFDRANSFVYINKALYNYRIGSGMTSKFDSQYYNTFKKIFKEIENRKEVWNMKSFDAYLSEKVLAMTGRAITQSRYNKWGGVREHIEYLREIRDDDMLCCSLNQLELNKQNLQRNHYFLLKLMMHNCLVPIIFMLDIKNIQDNIWGR